MGNHSARTRFATGAVTALAIALVSPATVDADRVHTARAPLECSDSERHVLNGVVIDGAKFGVRASGNCSVTIVNSVIMGGKDGVSAGGSASVQITNSTVYGGKTGLRAGGSSSISIANSDVGGRRVAFELSGTVSFTAANATFRGKRRVGSAVAFATSGSIKKLGAAKKKPASVGIGAKVGKTTGSAQGGVVGGRPGGVEGGVVGGVEGGVVGGVQGGVVGGVPGLKKHPPVNCDKRKVVTLRNVIIRNPRGVAVRATGRCVVNISNSTIRGSGGGVFADGRAKVSITNSTIETDGVAIRGSGAARISLTNTKAKGGTALQLDGTAKTTATNSTFRGKRSVSRSASYKNARNSRWLER